MCIRDRVIGLLALSLAGCSEAEVPSATPPGDDPLVKDVYKRQVHIQLERVGISDAHRVAVVRLHLDVTACARYRLCLLYTSRCV